MKLPQLHVGFGTLCGPATIFPVWADSPETQGLVTGSDTQLVVQELPTSEVGRLTVTNLGAKAPLLAEWQLLEGGQQHRIAEQTVLIGASETAVINVLCVEEGRWSGSAEHRSSGRRAPLQVHAGLMETMVPDLLLFNTPAGGGTPAIVRAQSARDFIGAIASNGFAFRDDAEHRSGNRTIPAWRFEGNHPQLPLKGVSIGGTDRADPHIAHLIAWNGKHSMLA